MLNIAYGLSSALLVLLLLFYYDGFAGLNAAMTNSVLAVVVVSYAAFHLVLALPLAVAGWGLLRCRQWARAILTVLSGLMILDFPVGSAIAGYNLWVLLTPETEPLFAAPSRKKKNAPAAVADAEHSAIQPEPVRYPRESA